MTYWNLSYKNFGSKLTFLLGKRGRNRGFKPSKILSLSWLLKIPNNP